MNKGEIKKIKNVVLKKNILVFDKLTKLQKSKTLKFSEGYKDFLNNSKTERRAAKQIVQAAEDRGFVNIEPRIWMRTFPDTRRKNLCNRSVL